MRHFDARDRRFVAALLRMTRRAAKRVIIAEQNAGEMRFDLSSAEPSAFVE